MSRPQSIDPDPGTPISRSHSRGTPNRNAPIRKLHRRWAARDTSHEISLQTLIETHDKDMKGHRIPRDILPINAEHFEFCNVYREITAFVKILAPLYRHQSISHVTIYTIPSVLFNRNRLI